MHGVQLMHFMCLISCNLLSIKCCKKPGLILSRKDLEASWIASLNSLFIVRPDKTNAIFGAGEIIWLDGFPLHAIRRRPSPRNTTPVLPPVIGRVTRQAPERYLLQRCILRRTPLANKHRLPARGRAPIGHQWFGDLASSALGASSLLGMRV